MIILPDVDLSTAMVGSSGTILLQNMGVGGGGVSANPTVLKNLPTLFMHNESGCGLSIILKDSQKSFNIAAGQWVPIAIGPGESAVIWKVKYILPNAPVNLLLTTYYFPGEPIPNIAVLGNSPIGIGGSVNNQVVSTLSNEGNAINTLVEDIGTVTNAQLWKIWTDHFIASVEQAGVAHTVFQGNTSGNPLKLGQSGDTTEVLGSLQVDQTLSLNTAVTDIAGDTSGVGHCYEDCTGSIKRVVIILDNYKHVGAAQPQFILPVPFLKGATIRVGNTNTNIGCWQGGTAVNINTLNNGTSTPANFILPANYGEVTGAFDRVLLPDLMGSTVGRAMIEIVGN